MRIKNTLLISLTAISLSMLGGCGNSTPPLVENTAVESIDVLEETEEVTEPEPEPEITIPEEEEVVEEVIDESIADDVSSIVYTNVQYKGWGDNRGIVACFTKPDGSCDYAFFTAEVTAQDDAASIKRCNSGITCSVSLDFDNLKIFDFDGIIVMSDDNRAVFVAYSDDAEKILTDNTEGYSTVRNDHVEVIYNDTITDEQAQEILDSCVYYADGNEMQKQYQLMQWSVVKK